MTRMEHPLPENAELASPLTPLIGRASELTALDAFLREPGPRLITLTGPGGVGKSRLAVHAADAARAHFDRMALVALAAIRDADLVVPAISQALGIPEAGDAPLPDRLARALRHGRMLLVIDNFEQVLAAAVSVAELLANAPGLTLIVTSRAHLNVMGEQAFPVLPLRVPPFAPQGALLSRHAAIRYGAVALFVARARLADPRFRLTDRNAGDVVAICRRLDGLPLAIELAAAWLRMVSLPALRKLLEQRLPILAGGPRDQPPRLRSMQAAISWSCDLLPPEEQALFRQLSVFDGGFTVEFAERLLAVHAACSGACSNSGGTSLPNARCSLLPRIAVLAAHSLVRPGSQLDIDESPQPRFSMLETIRDFGLERLDARGEGEEMRARHAALFLEFAEQAEQELVGPSEQTWIARTDAEVQNLREAIAWWLEHDAAKAVRLGAALWQFWYRTGRLAEGESWLDRALRRLPADSSAIRGKGLFVWGVLAGSQGHFPLAVQRLQEALPLLSASDDLASHALTETSLGIYALYGGDARGAIPHLERAATMYPSLTSASAASLGAFSGFQLAVAKYLAEPASADFALLDTPVSAVRATGSALLHLPTLSVLATLYWNAGYATRATAVWREALALAWAAGERWQAVDPLYGLAAAEASLGDVERAVELLGALDACCAASGTSPMIAGVMASRVEEVAATRLSTAEIGQLRARGARQPLAVVVNSVLQETAPENEAAAPALSPREREVLRLLADGRSDPEIAAALFVSRRTVATHVASVFRKLGVHSRAAASVAAMRAGIL